MVHRSIIRKAGADGKIIQGVSRGEGIGDSGRIILHICPIILERIAGLKSKIPWFLYIVNISSNGIGIHSCMIGVWRVIFASQHPPLVTQDDRQTLKFCEGIIKRSLSGVDPGIKVISFDIVVIL